MRFIAHRGNINGPAESATEYNKENNPEQIVEAIQRGFDVEIDVQYFGGNGRWAVLGHDMMTVHEVDIGFFSEYKDRLWCHAKTIDALRDLLLLGMHCFMHDKDDATLTSQGFIWTFPGRNLTDQSICVLPQFGPDGNPEQPEMWDCYGICSDYVQSLERIYNETVKPKRTE